MLILKWLWTRVLTAFMPSKGWVSFQAFDIRAVSATRFIVAIPTWGRFHRLPNTFPTHDSVSHTVGFFNPVQIPKRNGAPGQIRVDNLLITGQRLWPIELQGQRNCFVNSNKNWWGLIESNYLPNRFTL